MIRPAVQGVVAEASSFIGLNADRNAVSRLELYHAKLAAGDEDSQTIDQAVTRAGVRIPKHPGDYKPRDTVAVAAIQAAIGRRGAMRVRQYLEILAKAAHAPISANHIKVVEHLMTDDEFAGWIEPEDLTTAIVTHGAAAEAEARRFSATHGCPAWKGLANIWFQKSRKRRKAA
ncbi:hypothetical protein AB4144_14990 [Rhizobiaceae sp. 2RAB30]